MLLVATQASARLPLVLFLLVAFLSVGASSSLGQDLCDNKLEVEKGEGPGPFFGFEYVLYAYALAEKACGAPVISMSLKVLRAAEGEGCGSDTPMYALLSDSIRTMEEWNLKDLAQDGQTDLAMSEEQVQRWARATVNEFGGCPTLLDFHNQVQSGFSFKR